MTRRTGKTATLYHALYRTLYHALERTVLIGALTAVLERHVKAQPITAAYGTREGGDYCAACAEDWPCPDYTVAATALGTTDARA